MTDYRRAGDPDDTQGRALARAAARRDAIFDMRSARVSMESATAEKKPVIRGDEKLVEVRAYIPKSATVDAVTVILSDGKPMTCKVHLVQHVFATEE